MRASTFAMALTLGLALAAAAVCVAAGEPSVSIRFPNHGKYANAGEGQRDVRQTETALSAHLEQLALKALAADTQVNIEVLDIDLAGRISMRQLPVGVRVLDGRTDWPRIELRYTLTAGDGTVSRGQESFIEPTYLQRQLSASSDPLRHEKRLLRDWFRQRFPAQATARR
ncbi:MAG: hypothetical protein RLZZ618_287 [Pseudomonadota bacterium]